MYVVQWLGWAPPPKKISLGPFGEENKPQIGEKIAKRAGKWNFLRDVSAVRSQLGLWLAAWIWTLCVGASALTNQKPKFRSWSATEFWLLGALAASRGALLASNNRRPSFGHATGTGTVLQKFCLPAVFLFYSNFLCLCSFFWKIRPHFWKF